MTDYLKCRTEVSFSNPTIGKGRGNGYGRGARSFYSSHIGHGEGFKWGLKFSRFGHGKGYEFGCKLEDCEVGKYEQDRLLNL